MALLVTLLALANPTKAPSPEEQRLYAEGSRALATGDARGAEKAWQAGYAIGHDAAFLILIAEAEEKAGAPAEALATYRRYLREAPDAADRADIEQRVARLTPGARPRPLPVRGTNPPASSAGAWPQPRALLPIRDARSRQTSDRHRAPGHAGRRTGLGLEPLQRHGVRGRWRDRLLLGTAAFFAAEAASDSNDLNRLLNFRDQRTVPPTVIPPFRLSTRRRSQTDRVTIVMQRSRSSPPPPRPPFR